MGVSRVDYDNEILIDISNDTVTSELLAEGETAHDSNGELITGTFPIGEVDTQADLISQIKSALVGKTAGGGSSGSGIIDVTELPTENIDENAVYRVTESYKASATDIYIVMPDEYTGEIHASTLFENTEMNYNIYIVDEFPADMKIVDAETATELEIYVLTTDGIAYINVLGMGVVPLGLLLFEEEDLDKGFTNNPYAETESGVYTAIETYKQVVRWFVRKNSEWQEITAYTFDTAPDGTVVPYLLSGYLMTIATFLSGDFEEIDEGWFITPDGTAYNLIKTRMFTTERLKTAVIPHFIYGVESEGFSQCYGLTTVTFKGTPNYLSYDSFYYCDNLTTINVPFSEGEVAGAPWGATNATINYNYTEG